MIKVLHFLVSSNGVGPLLMESLAHGLLVLLLRLHDGKHRHYFTTS